MILTTGKDPSGTVRNVVDFRARLHIVLASARISRCNRSQIPLIQIPERGDIKAGREILMIEKERGTYWIGMEN